MEYQNMSTKTKMVYQELLRRFGQSDLVLETPVSFNSSPLPGRSPLPPPPPFHLNKFLNKISNMTGLSFEDCVAFVSGYLASQDQLDVFVDALPVTQTETETETENRRNRIKQQMKTLRSLIPNCRKRHKASIVDDALRYVKHLKTEVEMMCNASGIDPNSLDLSSSGMNLKFNFTTNSPPAPYNSPLAQPNQLSSFIMSHSIGSYPPLMIYVPADNTALNFSNPDQFNSAYAAPSQNVGNWNQAYVEPTSDHNTTDEANAVVNPMRNLNINDENK